MYVTARNSITNYRSPAARISLEGVYRTRTYFPAFTGNGIHVDQCLFIIVSGIRTSVRVGALRFTSPLAGVFGIYGQSKH